MVVFLGWALIYLFLKKKIAILLSRDKKDMIKEFI